MFNMLGFSAKEQKDPEPLPCLRDPDYTSYDVKLEVGIQGEGMKEPHIVSRSNFKNMYWNTRQQLVHQVHPSLQGLQEVKIT